MDQFIYKAVCQVARSRHVKVIMTLKKCMAQMGFVWANTTLHSAAGSGRNHYDVNIALELLFIGPIVDFERNIRDNMDRGRRIREPPIVRWMGAPPPRASRGGSGDAAPRRIQRFAELIGSTVAIWA